MFTGLIEEIGTIKSCKKSGDGSLITVEASVVLDGVKTGDSISIDGACQTVESFTSDVFSVFASKITLSLTTLGEYYPGRKVNLERAMSPSSRFGGHFVQGHVDGKGVVKTVEKDSSGVNVKIEASAGIINYTVEKGSIAVDGISLTVASLKNNTIGLYFIPETLRSTTAVSWKNGTGVNLEADILAKYVEKFAGRFMSGRDNDFSLAKKLSEGGFIG